VLFDAGAAAFEAEAAVAVVLAGVCDALAGVALLACEVVEAGCALADACACRGPAESPKTATTAHAIQPMTPRTRPPIKQPIDRLILGSCFGILPDRL
jgi:hypothetical protein